MEVVRKNISCMLCWVYTMALNRNWQYLLWSKWMPVRQADAFSIGGCKRGLDIERGWTTFGLRSGCEGDLVTKRLCEMWLHEHWLCWMLLHVTEWLCAIVSFTDGRSTYAAHFVCILIIARCAPITNGKGGQDTNRGANRRLDLAREYEVTFGVVFSVVYLDLYARFVRRYILSNSVSVVLVYRNWTFYTYSWNSI